MKRGDLLRSIYLKIAICIGVTLLLLAQSIMPAFAATTIQMMLDPSYIGGWVQNPNGSKDLTSGDVIYRSASTPYDVGSYGRLYFSVFDLDVSGFPRPDSSYYTQSDVYLKFTLNSNGTNISNEVMSCNMIMGFIIPQYRQNYYYEIVSVDLTGGPDLFEGSTPDFLTYTSDGGKFFKFDIHDFNDSSGDGNTLIGESFREITVHIRWDGRPSAGYIQLAFWNENSIVVSGYSPDNNGIVQGLDDVRNEIDRTNDLLTDPLSPEESAALEQQQDTNDQVRSEAESMADALDQFEAPTDDIQGVNDSITGAIDQYPDEVGILTLDFSDSSEFFNTVTIVGVPGLGICFLGYVLYGKKG